MKTCKRCKRKMPATTEYFNKYSKSSDGLFYYCKACQKEINQKYLDKDKQKRAEQKILLKIEKENISQLQNQTCSRCNISKPLTEYNHKTDNSNEYYEYCKVCQAKEEKLCIACNTFRPYGEFYEKKSNADGHMAKCKECIALENKLLTYKLCPECGKWVLRSKYYKNRTTEDGLHIMCKSCCLTNDITSSHYRKKRDIKHYNNYWGGQIGLPHAKYTNNLDD